MPRQARIHIDGGLYHVMTRGLDRKKIFLDKEDRKDILERMGENLLKAKQRCYAWALMPNHIHFLIRASHIPLSESLKKVFTGYAISFNHRHKKVGYLFQNRYKAILCQEDIYFKQLVRYIHLNPLRAKIVESLSKLEKYPWTGYKGLMDNSPYEWQEISGVLQEFGSKKRAAREKYRQYMVEGVGEGYRADLMGGGLIRSAGGWKEAVKLRKEKTYWESDARVLGDGEYVTSILKSAEEGEEESRRLRREGWTLKRLKKVVCEAYDIEERDLKKRGRENSISEAKGILAYLGYKKLRVGGRDLMKTLGMSRPGLKKSIERGESQGGKALKLIS